MIEKPDPGFYLPLPRAIDPQPQINLRLLRCALNRSRTGLHCHFLHALGWKTKRKFSQDCDHLRITSFEMSSACCATLWSERACERIALIESRPGSSKFVLRTCRLRVSIWAITVRT